MWTWNKWMITGKIKEMASDLQDFYLLSIRGLVGIIKKPFYFKDTIEQMDYAGAGSLLIILGHQVDTLRVFGVDPIKKLVTPRILSSLVMLPALTIIGDAVSLLGGYYIAVFVSHQSGAFYWSSIREILIFDNVFAGSVKPFIFGYLIACISCYMGLSTKGGSIGLRRSTTRAVVASMIVIIVSDFLLTRILLYVLGFSV